MLEDPGDVDLDKPVSDERPGPSAPRGPSPALLAGIGVLLLALAVAYILLRRPTLETNTPAATTTPPTTAPVQQAEPAEPIVLPPLDDTDPLVRQLVERLSSHPAVAAWLTTDGLLLNFVVVTTRIANGESPVNELKTLGPIPRVRTLGPDDNRSIDPSSYRRYDRHAAAVSALDARGAARLYATLKPRIVDAYGRLGRSDGNFDRVLERAIVEVLRVPVIDGEIALVPHGAVYAFADPRLQELSAPQKQVLRMGPQNVRAVQAKLREIAAHIGIPASRLP
jgi:hypothetical protein